MGEKKQFTFWTNNPSLTTGSTTLFEGLVQVRRQRIMRPPNWKLSMLYKVYHLINRPLLSESGNVNPQYELVWAVEHQGWNPISVGSLGWLGREQEVYRHCPRGHADRGPHAHAGLTNWATQMEERAWWVVYRPVSGLHNGTASFTNPMLSPTSELYKLKGTEDFSYCTKSLSRIFLFDQTSSNVLIVSAWECWSSQTQFHTHAKPLKNIFYTHPIFFGPDFWKTK